MIAMATGPSSRTGTRVGITMTDATATGTIGRSSSNHRSMQTGAGRPHPAPGSTTGHGSSKHALGQTQCLCYLVVGIWMGVQTAHCCAHAQCFGCRRDVMLSQLFIQLISPLPASHCSRYSSTGCQPCNSCMQTRKQQLQQQLQSC